MRNTEISREEFFEHGLHAATGYNITFAGTASQLADRMEEMFEATGSRGGFMLSISQAAPRECCRTSSTISYRSCNDGDRYRTSYEGKTLRENMSA